MTSPGLRRAESRRQARVERRLSAGPIVPADPGGYTAFGNVEARNSLQARIELPLLISALGLPRGGRVLEIGCGRGIALPVLAERLVPTALVGVDIDPAL